MLISREPIYKYICWSFLFVSVV